jgi:hypothetical protein
MAYQGFGTCMTHCNRDCTMTCITTVEDSICPSAASRAYNPCRKPMPRMESNYGCVLVQERHSKLRIPQRISQTRETSEQRIFAWSQHI